MTNTPYTVNTTWRDTDNSTVLNGATVELFNVNNQERLTKTTNTQGQAQFNLGNLETQWADEDLIIISCYTKSGVRRSADYIFTIDTDAHPDGYNTGTLAVMPGPRLFNERIENQVTMLSALVSSTNDGDDNLTLYDRANGQEIMKFCLTSEQKTVPWCGCIVFAGGIAKVPSNQGKFHPAIEVR